MCRWFFLLGFWFLALFLSCLIGSRLVPSETPLWFQGSMVGSSLSRYVCWSFLVELIILDTANSRIDIGFLDLWLINGIRALSIGSDYACPAFFTLFYTLSSFEFKSVCVLWTWMEFYSEIISIYMIIVVLCCTNCNWSFETRWEIVRSVTEAFFPFLPFLDDLSYLSCAFFKYELMYISLTLRRSKLSLERHEKVPENHAFWRVLAPGPSWCRLGFPNPIRGWKQLYGTKRCRFSWP